MGAHCTVHYSFNLDFLYCVCVRTREHCCVSILFCSDFYLESSRERLLQLLKAVLAAGKGEADRHTLRCMKPWRCVCCFFSSLFRLGLWEKRRGAVVEHSPVGCSQSPSRVLATQRRLLSLSLVSSCVAVAQSQLYPNCIICISCVRVFHSFSTALRREISRLSSHDTNRFVSTATFVFHWVGDALF